MNIYSLNTNKIILNKEELKILVNLLLDSVMLNDLLLLIKVIVIPI